MFKRSKAQHDAEETPEEPIAPFFGGAASDGDENGEFPSPHSFDVDGESDTDTVGVDVDDSSSDLPFDQDDSFANGADKDEFLEGNTDSFVDDDKKDYHAYGASKDTLTNDHAETEVNASEAIKQDQSSQLDKNAAEPQQTSPVAARHASEAMTGSDDSMSLPQTNDAPVVENAHASAPAHGRHGRPAAATEHEKHARRMRRALIIVVVFLIVLLLALAYFGFQLLQTSHSVATQQSQANNTEVSTTDSSNETKDASSTATKKTSVPPLTSVMGASQADALKTIGHGATVSTTVDVNEEGNPIKKRLTCALTDEPADAKMGTPSVYLGLNEAGQVIMAGYSASTSSLGYGSLSFADAVSSQHIVEKTLNDAGLSVPEGSVKLPDKASYSTYAGDGTTLVKENCSFTGSSVAGGATYSWTATLMYDYTAANANSNLADTVRQIYIYINAA
ncbi:MAG: histone-lysine N-methyltransferase [Eggerthellaceae bacterium]|jgi:hypothetical protein|nr:histone-lysine N-methyltransferase [Eggerthellaceae bacterium]